jgi:hypothetical protein
MGLSGIWRMQHPLNSHIRKTACCLFVTIEMIGVNFVGVLIAKYACARNPVSNCFTFKLTFETYSWHRTPQYSAAVGIIVTFFWHYLIAKAFGSGNWNCFTLKLTFETYSWHRTPQYSAAVGIIVTFFWHYLIAKAFGSGSWVRDNECYRIVRRLLTTRVYLFSWRCSVTVLLKTYVPSNVTLKSHYKLLHQTEANKWNSKFMAKSDKIVTKYSI